MSAAASSVDRFALLTETSKQIVQKTTTSFTPSRTDAKEYTISLYCHKKTDSKTSFQTRFKLVFQTATEMNESVAAFLKAGVRVHNLVVCERIKPTTKTERATIELGLWAPEDLENLKRHANELIPTAEWDLETQEKDEITGRPAARLRHKVVQDAASQKALIQRDLPNVVGKLISNYSLDEMLARNNDSAFPGAASSVGGSVMLWEDALDECRNYRLESGKLSEELDVPGLDEAECLVPVTPEEVEGWLLDPASQKGKSMEKCTAVFASAFGKAMNGLSEDSSNAGKISRMASAASNHLQLAKALPKFVVPPSK